ncbi:Coronin-like protein crn1 [Pleurotus pulmonarius]|nr:Coronin-like protein crn1 [Pleurotus pulmonarius]KAF4592728.1 Coronin-like protein crn1 [Pleurotus pulmonarius]
MSRFVRASKYRHVFGQPAKKEYNIENIKVTNSAWDTNVISVSAKYLSVNWNASGGGAFAILPLPTPFAPISGSFPSKLPDTLPIARSHTAPVLDTDWSPHNDSIVASAGEDGNVFIWKVESSEFDGWGEEGWVPQDFDPVAKIVASPRKIGQVVFHPTANMVLASASGEHTVKLWDLDNTDSPKSTLVGHNDTIQSIAFNPTGTLLATTCRDRKLRLFDPRAGSEAVRVADGHGGVKGSRVTFMGDHDRIATTGFSKMSDRQVGIWDSGSLNSIKMTVLDQSAGVVMPFWSDNNILFLAGKGDGNIRYYEYESDALFALDEHKSTDPQRGMCFLPRRALNVSECEIARAYKIFGNTIESIAFKVPRRADSFQSDIFPPAPSYEPSLSASEFFSGKEIKRKLVSLDSGETTTSSTAAAAPPSALSSPVSPAAAPPAAVSAAPAPSPLSPPPFTPTSAAVSTPTSANPISRSVSESVAHAPIRSQTVPSSASGSGDETALKRENDKLKSENARLTEELRDAREKMRNLELQVESVRANARKAAQALLDG